MRLTGILRSWNDDRGFGFIGPRHGGAEIFVHITALPRDGSRPTVGETLSYELGRGRDGQPQAINVVRLAVGTPKNRPAAPQRSPRRHRAWLPRLIGVVLLSAVGAYGYRHYQGRVSSHAAPTQGPALPAAGTVVPPVDAARYSCDGRTHCSQMTSCAEARYFLANCPGTQLDGDHDGIPCEGQWCAGPSAR